jgi:maltose/moltooligosaccharide transporter
MVFQNRAPETEASPRKIWSVGTLTYTTGGLVALFCWLLWGDFAWSMKERCVPGIVSLLLKKVSASDTLVAILMGTLPQAFIIVLGPIIGSLSDRHRGPLGRRIPFLAFPIPLAVLAIMGMTFSQQIGLSLDHLLGRWSAGVTATTLVVVGVCWTGFEIPTTIANAVFGGLINDVVPRAVIGRFYGMFRALSLIAGIISGRWLLGKAEKYYSEIFIGLALLYGIGFLSMCLNVKEGKYPPPAPIPEGNKATTFLSTARSYFQDCYTHSYYLWLYGAVSLSWISFGPANLFNLFFAQSVNMDMDTYWHYIALTYVISLVLAYPIGWLADKIHPLRSGLIMIGAYAAVMLWGGIFATTSKTFAAALVAHGVLSGAWLTTTASMGQKLFPKGKYAQFNSALWIVAGVG